MASGRELQAVASLQILTELEPGSCEAWYLLGETCRRVGNLEKAESALTRAQELLDTDSDGNRIEEFRIDFELGRMYFQMSEYRKAAFFLSRVIPHLPCSLFLHRQLCHCFFRSSAWNDLEVEEERYLEQDPEELADHITYWLDDDLFSTDAYNHLGQLAYRRGDQAKAMVYFEKAFYARAQYELNSEISEQLATCDLDDYELECLARFQESINGRLDHPLLTESDNEMIRREARRFQDDRMQLKLDFGK